MTEEKIRTVAEIFAEEAQKIYGNKLRSVILYGSCATATLMFSCL